MSDTVILSALTGIGVGLSCFGKYVANKLDECAADRLQLRGDVGELKSSVKECLEDRQELRGELLQLRSEMGRVNRHIEHTDKTVIKNEKKAE